MTELTSCALCAGEHGEESICANCMISLIDLGLEAEHTERSQVDIEHVSDYARVDSPQSHRYGHYDILARADGSPWELGRGSMGVTYKAFDTGLQCVVALKLINSQALGGHRAQERFQFEARSAAKLRHPNIASVLHLAERGGTWFYAMEFIEGQTLWDIVENTGPLPWRSALNIVTQIGRGLGVAHEHAFVHRDVKPGNIMLTKPLPPDGNNVPLAKLIDFGLVKSKTDQLDDRETTEAYFVGTPSFASPEQVNTGNAEVRSDIYSLGATFFYLITGSPPQASRDDNRRAIRVKAGAVPAAVVGLIESMLSPDIAQRPTSAKELVVRCMACAETKRRSIIFHSLLHWAPIFGVSVILALAGMLVWRPTFSRDQFKNLQNPFAAMPPSQNLEAYTAQVRAKERFLKITEEDNRQAIALFSQAIRLDANYPLARAGLAEAYGQGVRRGWLPKERMVDAMQNAKDAIKLDPGSAEAHFALATVYSQQELPWKSLDQLHRSLQINPAFEPAMRGFGLAWVMVGHPEKGLPWLKAAAARDPTSSKVWISIADAYKDLCADQQAEESFQKARELEPESLGTLYGLIHLDILRGQYDAAQALCDRGMALRPNDRYALTLSAQIALFRGDLPRADAIYRSLLIQDHQGDVTFYGGIRYLSALSYIAARSGRSAEATSLSSEAEALDRAAISDGPQALYDLAAVQASRGDTQTAIESFGAAVSQGWLDYRAAYVDPRFSNVRKLPEFSKIVDRVRSSLALRLEMAETLCARPVALDEYPIVCTPKKRG